MALKFKALLGTVALILLSFAGFSQANTVTAKTVNATAHLYISGHKADSISLDGTFTSNSDILLPSQKAVKTYVDSRKDTVPIQHNTGVWLIYANAAQTAIFDKTIRNTGNSVVATTNSDSTISLNLASTDSLIFGKTDVLASQDRHFTINGHDFRVDFDGSGNNGIYFDHTASVANLFYNVLGTGSSTVDVSPGGAELAWYDFGSSSFGDVVNFVHNGVMRLSAYKGVSIEDDFTFNGSSTAPASSAVLDIRSVSNNKGILIPRLTTTQQNAISSPTQGTIIYNTDTLGLVDYSTTLGWRKERSVGAGGSGITSLNGLTTTTQTFAHNSTGSTGTTFNVTSTGSVHTFNTPLYYDYGIRSIPGSFNLFWGSNVGSNSITTAQFNTGFGSNVLSSLTTGQWNTAFGTGALNSTATGIQNTAMGWLASALCQTCQYETSIGAGALSGDTAGMYNTAIGAGAGDFTSYGQHNLYAGNQSGQTDTRSFGVVKLGSRVGANTDYDTAVIEIGYINNYTNHKNSVRSIMIGDNIANTFSTHYDSTILIGSGITVLSSADTLVRNLTVVGNFIQSNRNNFAVFGGKTQLVELGNGGGTTTTRNGFTAVESDIWYNTTNHTYEQYNGTSWVSLGGAATVNTTNSVTGDGSVGTPIKLVNDAATPGNSQYYGTNSSGTKGYFALPTTTSVPLSSLTAATATNSIANGNNTQTWNFDLLSGSAVQFYANTTAAAGNAQKVLDILLQGTNATSGQTTYAADIQNLHAGVAGPCIALHLKVNDLTTNFPLVTEGGFVGIGTVTPTQNLEVSGAASSILYVTERNSGGFTEISGRTHNGTGQVEIYALPSTYSGTAGTGFAPSFGYMRFTGTGGGNIGAQNATGVLKFFTGGEAVINERARVDAAGRVMVDTTAAVSRFSVGGSFADNNPGVRGFLSTFDKSVFTDNTSTASSTVASIAQNSFLQGYVSSLQTNVTYTDGATVYIDSALKSRTNTTITNPWAFFIKTGKAHFGGDIQATSNLNVQGHYLSTGSTPTTTNNTGAGTSPTVSITGTDDGGLITVTTGSSPANNAVVITVNYTATFPTGTYVTLTPNNLNAAGLTGATGIYVTSTGSGFNITSGSTGLAASTQYVWSYTISGQ